MSAFACKGRAPTRGFWGESALKKIGVYMKKGLDISDLSPHYKTADDMHGLSIKIMETSQHLCRFFAHHNKG